MKKLFFLFCLLFLASPAFAQSSPADYEYRDWITYYYKDKDSSQTEEFMHWLQTSQILERQPNAMKPLAAFLSVIFMDNPSKLSDWLAAEHYTGNTKTTIEAALWLAGQQEELETFANDATPYEQPAPDLSEIAAVDPTDCDVVWGAFQASGNPIYVQKIIDALDSSYTVTRRAAQWSLGSNMKQHALVNYIVQSEAQTRTGATRQILQGLMAKFPSPAQSQRI